jgi:hypothetical protein
MTKRFLIQLLVGTFFISGCATLRAQNCTENAGYEKGMNDAKMGRLMSMTQNTLLCEGGEIELVQKGYRAGYEAGKSTQSGPGFNLTFQNGKLGIVGAYSCQLNYSNQSFTDEGSTEAGARGGVFNKCRQKFPHCSEAGITCHKN